MYNKQVETMNTQFIKTNFNENFNYESEVVDIFLKLGFNNVEITTCTTNGLSHYISVLDFKVLDEKKLYSEMAVFEGETFINVRISDHASNLDTICGGVDGNKMNLNAFENLIKTGAITNLK